MTAFTSLSKYVDKQNKHKMSTCDSKTALFA